MTLKVPHTSYLAGVTFRVPLQLVLATRVAALCPACTGPLRRAAVTDLERDPVACPVPGLQQRVRAATSSASRIGPVRPPGFGAPLGRSQAIRLKSSAGSIPAASIFGRLAAHVAFVPMLRYGRPSGFRAHVEAVVARAGRARPRLCSRLVDRGGRDAFLDRVPDLAPGWTRACKARGEFRDRLARAECACVSARPSPLRQGRALRPLRQSDGFRQGLPSGLVACLSWRLPATDGPGVSLRLSGSGRRLALASAAALTFSTWVAKGERDQLRVARLNGLSHRSNPPPP
jgi:hypothetical protein